jgi:hypothetical protein
MSVSWWTGSASRAMELSGKRLASAAPLGKDFYLWALPWSFAL